MARVVVQVPDALEAAFARVAPTVVRALAGTSDPALEPTQEAPRRKYDAVAVLIASRAEELESEVVVVSVHELDALVRGGMPRSAWAWSGWWAASQPQARAWTEAGWVARPLLAEGVVVFRRASAPAARAPGGPVAP